MPASGKTVQMERTALAKALSVQLYDELREEASVGEQIELTQVEGQIEPDDGVSSSKLSTRGCRLSRGRASALAAW